MIAPAMNTNSNTKRRCFASQSRDTSPIRVTAKMMTGISNTRPTPRMNVVTNEMYSLARGEASNTSLPKVNRKLIAFGRSRK